MSSPSASAAQDLAASKWQSIRPWDPRLSLAVKEITSVSATFVLSSLSTHSNLSAILDGDDDDANDTDDAFHTSATQILADAQAKGLSVKVNGAPWRRVLARVDDEADEAVIIIYSLLPGKQYDIEFGIVPGEDRVKSQIVTGTEQPKGTKLADAVDIPDIVLPPEPALSHDPLPSPPSSSPPSTPGSASPGAPSQSFDEYLASLQRTLAHLHTENDSLLTDLKSARRDAHKSQASLRTEIAALKKAAQKHAALDVRMRQRARALEEATKQAVRNRADIDATRTALEAEHVARAPEREVARTQWDDARAAAERARAEREAAEEDAAARVAGAKADLAALEARLERLRARREKLDGGARNGAEPAGTVGELRARLRALQRERKAVEDDPYGSVADREAEQRSPRVHTHTHQRNQTHPHTHAHGHAHHGPSGGSVGGFFGPPKRRNQFAPPHILQRAPGAPAFVPPPVNAQAQRPPPPPVQRPQQQQPPRGGRPAAARRKSSPTSTQPPPPAPSEKSTLSSLAPPFEPASVRGRGPTWGPS